MIMSMTGYGRAQQVIEGHDVTVELRSVNHRYFECSVRTPRAYGYLEEKLKSCLQSRMSRGKIEAGIYIQTVEGPSAQVEINHALAGEYLQALRNMGSSLGIRDDITVSAMARFSDIFTVLKVQEDEDYIWKLVSPVADEAVGRFLEMRRAEGERMQRDILDRAEQVRRMVERVKERSPETVRLYRERLYQKLQEVLGDRQIDEQPPSLPTGWRWTRRRSAWKAICPPWRRFFAPREPWGASWISWSRRSTGRPTPSVPRPRTSKLPAW